MTDKELRQMNRRELLELLTVQSRENDRLREQLEQAEQRLADRQIQLEEAGSIAEAAVRINQVFSAAQDAAEQYLENVRALESRRQESQQREAESARKAEAMLAETEARCREMEAAAKQRCEEMLRRAEEEPEPPAPDSAASPTPEEQDDPHGVNTITEGQQTDE